jgi:hypothetical protein
MPAALAMATLAATHSISQRRLAAMRPTHLAWSTKASATLLTTRSLRRGMTLKRQK